MITLYGIANCDKIRKTRQWLDGQGVNYEFHDYRKQGAPATLIAEFLEAFDYRELINTRGTTWRGLPAPVRENLDTASAANLMQEHPALIKRPLLNINNHWLLGYDTARMQTLLND